MPLGPHWLGLLDLLTGCQRLPPDRAELLVHPRDHLPHRPAAVPLQARPQQPSTLQHSGGSAPPQLAGALQAAAASAGGPAPSSPLPPTQSYGRPSAPTLLDTDYPPPAVGAGPADRPQHLPVSVSGRHQSAPRLEDESWWSSTPAVPPSRAQSELAGGAAVASAPPGLTGAGGSGNPFDADPDTCVVCLDAPATAGVLHGDSVHK